MIAEIEKLYGDQPKVKEMSENAAKASSDGYQ